jgi:hypothetical protein
MDLIFLNKLLNLQKLDVWCPGRFVSWTFCNWTFGNWTFGILDVLYPGRSVTGPLVTGRYVTGRFVTGRYVTGRFVGVPPLPLPSSRHWLGKGFLFTKCKYS